MGRFAGTLKIQALAVRERLRRHGTLRVLESTVDGAVKDDVLTYAAAMTYYGVFSLFSLLLLATSLVGLALQNNEETRARMLGIVVGYLPQGQEQLSTMITGVIETKGIAAGLGSVSLLWVALGWFQAVDATINPIWGIRKPRPFVKGLVFSLAMSTAIGGVAIASFAATVVANLVVQLFGGDPAGTALWRGVISALSVASVAAVFYVLYRFTPQREVQHGDVWPAALVTALLWEASRLVLAFYIEKTNMVTVYGPVGAMMALLFWIYVASNIILIGAELSYAIAKERRNLGPEREMQVMAPPGEQPSIKFAPQVGRGLTTPLGEDEPTRPPL
ncbi:MAG: hypothetical protein AVDCRST_MAG77-4666 [uncultured Chloroflexi bacterium]|uniref:Uncharacterized protein n=1 Tax=uncultured Chloroflexota bacterium TaxID=166587 RepID=A0A6J4JXV1_9CHLR|nr:MAG: hypothetical protein AVDCRST_MAG77-4666 [uncultured Chloroflexota bacterium]